MKDTKMDVPIVKKFTGVKNVPLLKSHVLCVKELIITRLVSIFHRDTTSGSTSKGRNEEGYPRVEGSIHEEEKEGH